MVPDLSSRRRRAEQRQPGDDDQIADALRTHYRQRPPAHVVAGHLGELRRTQRIRRARGHLRASAVTALTVAAAALALVAPGILGFGGVSTRIGTAQPADPAADGAGQVDGSDARTIESGRFDPDSPVTSLVAAVAAERDGQASAPLDGGGRAGSVGTIAIIGIRRTTLSTQRKPTGSMNACILIRRQLTLHWSEHRARSGD